MVLVVLFGTGMACRTPLASLIRDGQAVDGVVDALDRVFRGAHEVEMEKFAREEMPFCFPSRVCFLVGGEPTDGRRAVWACEVSYRFRRGTGW